MFYSFDIIVQLLLNVALLIVINNSHEHIRLIRMPIHTHSHFCAHIYLCIYIFMYARCVPLSAIVVIISF